MIQFECPNCSRPIKVKPELAGRKGKCPGCQSILVIPAPEPPKAEPPEYEFSSSSGSEFELEPPISRPDVTQSSFETSQPAYSAERARHYNDSKESQLPIGLGIGSTVAGTLSVICVCCVGLYQFPIAAIGLGLGIAGIIYSKGQEGGARVMPIIGTIISGAGILLGILMLIMWLVGMSLFNNFNNSFEELIKEGARQREIEMQEELQRQEEEAALQQEIESMREDEMEGLQPFADEENDPFAAPESVDPTD